MNETLALAPWRALFGPRALPRVHAVLLTGFVLYTFVGTHPFAGASVGDRVEGSVFDRVAVLSMFFLALFEVWTKRRTAISCVLANIPMFCVLGVAVLSILWSDYPDLTLRRALLLLFLTVIALGVAVGITDLRRFHTFLFVSLTAIILVNIVGTALFPSLAISDIGVQGIYTQKNVAGIVAMITTICGATWILGAERARSALLGLLAVVPTIVFLIITRSKTSISLTVLALGVCALFVVVERLGAKFALFIIFLGLVAIAALLGFVAAIDFDANRIAGVVVGDATFTGRDELWAFALKSARERNWLGHGYGAFWDVGLVNDPLARLEPGTWLAEVPVGTINQAHNGYLELWLHIGLPAMIVAALAVGAGAVLAGIRAVASPAPRQTRAAFGFLATVLFLHVTHNFTEATLFMRGAAFCSIVILALLVGARVDLLGAPARGPAARRNMHVAQVQ